MIESPKNFIEQFQNFIEHIAGLMKTFLTKEVADNYYLGKSDNAVSATKATQDASGNVITSTYATKTEVTSGLSGKLGKTEKASSARTADTVAWNNITGKPNIPATPNAYIVETWRYKTKWYRKWSDGFIEQGGFETVYGLADFTVTFNRPFSSANCVIVSLTPKSTYFTAATINCVKTISASNMVVANGDSVTDGFYWRACGY